jgi:hypothetical protein
MVDFPDDVSGGRDYQAILYSFFVLLLLPLSIDIFLIYRSLLNSIPFFWSTQSAPHGSL